MPSRNGDPPTIDAQGKHVIVIGGGDTGSDCVGTSIRQAGRVGHATRNPAASRPKASNPETPLARSGRKIMRTSSSQEEGCAAPLERADEGPRRCRRPRRADSTAARSSGSSGPKGWEMQEVPGTEFTLPADLVLIAMGFVHVVHAGLVERAGPATRQSRQRGGRRVG